MGIVTFNPMNTKGNMVPLFFFDTIFDTDVGVLAYIEKHLLDPTIFNEIEFKCPIKSMVRKIYDREEQNPLLYFLLKKDKEYADEILLEMITDPDCYKEIVDLAMTTDFYDFLSNISKAQDINPIVVYRNPIELDVWNATVPEKWKQLIPIYSMTELMSNGRLRYIQQIFCKYPEDALSLYKDAEPIVDRTIYLVNYKFNFEKGEDGEVLNPQTNMLSYHNDIYSVDIYNREMLYKKEG